MRTPRLLLAAAAAAAALALAAPARAGTPAQDLAWLNAKRAANGIPAGVVEVPEWSAACRQHLRYIRETGTMSHAENPASPSYTTAGNWAGTHAVLASAEPWTAANFIWEYAPLHLAQLLAPELAKVGIADDGQLVCVTTWPGYTRPVPTGTSILSYPGNGTGTYPSEFSREWPITPAQALNLANPTGPHLYVYAWGPGAETGFGENGVPIAIRSASLSGPNGAVPVRWVDAESGVVGRYLPPAAGIIIPTRTLVRYERYTASVMLTDGTTRSWAFTTADGGERLAIRNVRFRASRLVHVRDCRRWRRGRCVRGRWRHMTQLRLSGRYVDDDYDTEGRETAVEVQLDGATRSLLVASARTGVFTGRFAQVVGRRRVRLIVRIRAGDDFAAFHVQVRLGRRRGSLVAIVSDPRIRPRRLTVPPVRPRRPR